MRGAEQIPCPCCGGLLKVKGSRSRKYIDDNCNLVILRIRRLGCGCGRIHHELPDILVPYKRYGRESIEAVISPAVTPNEIPLSVAADDSTLSRWRNWFRNYAAYMAACLVSAAIEYQKRTVESFSDLPDSALQRIWTFVNDTSGWLARTVRIVVNLNNWVHTRSAFMSRSR